MLLELCGLSWLEHAFYQKVSHAQRICEVFGSRRIFVVAIRSGLVVCDVAGLIITRPFNGFVYLTLAVLVVLLVAVAVALVVVEIVIAL